MITPAIDVRNLRKSRSGITAVHDVSFTVGRGSITGFLGPNGAGKSTTMHMLLGLIRPDSGHCRVNGSPYRELVRPTRVVGAVTEIAAAHPAMTAVDHLRTYAAYSGVGSTRVSAVMELLEIERFAQARVRSLSTGMRQRLALATALLGDPKILILDEPCNGLDPEGMAWLKDFLRHFAASGGSVLLSSHILHDIAAVTDTVIVMHHGRLIWSGPTADLLAMGPGIEDAFLALTTRTETS